MTDDAGVVLQSPEQMMKIMGVIAVVCIAFGLTVLEAKTEVMRLRTKEMSEPTVIFNVEAAGHVYNQTNEFVYLGGSVNHNERRPAHRGQPAQRMVQLPEVHPRTIQPTERFLRAHNPDAKSRDTRDNAVQLRHVEPACVPLRYAASSPAHHSFLTCCIGRQKNNRTNHPILYLETLIMTGSGSIEMIMLRRRIIFVGFVTHMEDTSLPECIMFGAVVERAGCVGGGENIVDGVSPGRPQSFRYRRDQWTTAAQDVVEWRKTAEKWAERFMAKWFATEKVRAGLQHIVVGPNMTGRTKDNIAQTKRARVGSLAIFD